MLYICNLRQLENIISPVMGIFSLGRSLLLIFVAGFLALISMKKRIIKFGKPKGECPPCDKVSEYLESRGIKVENVNPFETEDYDLILKHNITTVPVTVLVDEEGNSILRKAGFNEKALNSLIERFESNE